jgi:hypothetical protein
MLNPRFPRVGEEVSGHVTAAGIALRDALKSLRETISYSKKGRFEEAVLVPCREKRR